MAAGVTFYAILALFPALAATVSLFGLFADPGTIGNQLQDLSGVLPGGAVEVVGGELQRLASQGGKTLGFAFFIGLAVALWSANAGIAALIDSLNIVYDEAEERGLFKRYAVSFVFTLGSIAFILLAVGALALLPLVIDYLPLGPAAKSSIGPIKWAILIIGLMLGLSLLYRFGPHRKLVRWRAMSWGSVVAALTWFGASILFSWYAANFGSYNKTYGSLGAIVGFMVWIWISAIVVLLGGELDSEIERQRRGRAQDHGPGRRPP
jgi:membrane protein